MNGVNNERSFPLGREVSASQTIEDCILPEATKATFKEFLKKGEVPNLLLCGTAGTGKTTVARALCEELGCDYIVINGSDEGRQIDTLRTKIKSFASAISVLRARLRL